MTVHKLDVETTMPHTPDDILESAKGSLERVTVIGQDKDGQLWISGNQSDMSLMLLDLEMAKAWIMREIMDLNLLNNDPVA